MIMKTTLLICSCALGFALTAPAQTPTPPPDATAPTVSTSPEAFAAPPVAAVSMTPQPTATVAPSASVAATTTPSAGPKTEDEFDSAIEKKIRKHFSVDFDGGHSGYNSDDVPWMAIPIVLIVFLTIFGLPVAIVGLIMYFSFSKSRALHKTVRMMVEKGQPVPEALLNPPPVVRQRSDLRRGVVLLMVGAGLMVFFGAVNDWEGGVWSLGIIPFLIGLGYILVWRLDVRREDPSPRV
jgi:Domain of unknown function (DUF6249)